uniref:ATP synthase F0 subunit 8 n=1 Tax=Megacopta centronubila TaxID=2968963 RepID=UPI002237AEBE|nr:ATP synthase F0 subunit 8 [Megacopta centronubila]UYA97697.1 ATP synthase F0 subunit 8 [Megacopta centronubila]UYA97710.1 ATP synthase F0 subunit 8 [Megacopta centronubila]
MPQMSYMWWEMLFIMFNMLMIIMIIYNYHNPNIKWNYLISSANNVKQANWKW